MNINSRLTGELQTKSYRDGYVRAQIAINLPSQIRALRVRQKLSQSELAEKAEMAQSRISEMETPGARRLTIETLLRLASALDVALEVHFVSFSDLIRRREAFDPDRFNVSDFAEDLKVAAAKSVQPQALQRAWVEAGFRGQSPRPRSVIDYGAVVRAASGTAHRIQTAPSVSPQ